jgi:serine acetyltransferase/GT2 family glycosyltransferase
VGSLFGGALRAVAAKPSANPKAGTTPLPPRVKGNGAGHGTAISVVVPTFNRGIRLARLLQHLAEQTLPHTDFEVIVVDDGSSPPAAVELDRERATGRPFPLRFRLEVQPNSGAAAARHRGALLAEGNLLLFVDDDMQVPPGFLAAHRHIHETSATSTVVLGEIRSDPGLEHMPLFERYHAKMLELFTRGVREGTRIPQGTDLCTGNVSMRRADYLAVGGFDPTFERSEDAELGVRLEKAGARLHFSEAAHSVHGSDHTELETWRARAFRYGVHDLRLSRKHREWTQASPFRFLGKVHPLSRPLLTSALLAPVPSALLSRVLLRGALQLDARGLESVAIKLMTLVYGMEYFRGIRTEEGSSLAAVRDALAHLTSASGGAALATFWSDLREDHATLRRYEQKYHHRELSPDRLARDLTEKVGFQIMAGYRLMRAFRAAGQLTAAKAVSRLIRHLYGSDIHWDAEFAPGVLVVHGMGMAISHSAKVGPGCILNQHVTLGDGTDPLTRLTGAPTLGRDVHVGAGATLIGPIQVGDQSKIMPGAFLSHSVEARSLVRVPEGIAEPRTSGANQGRLSDP